MYMLLINHGWTRVNPNLTEVEFCLADLIPIAGNPSRSSPYISCDSVGGERLVLQLYPISLHDNVGACVHFIYLFLYYWVYNLTPFPLFDSQLSTGTRMS